jgi:SAM-dependent methyltransferase
MTTPPPIQFTNGAAYERYMGLWSQQVGQAFIDWLGAPAGGRWLDVGCGNGAFTELVAQRCQPQSLAGIDPSAQQLDFARARASTAQAEYVQGDAMALPYGAAQFDVAVMPLVIFFLSDPALGVAEMARVVRPGGLVAAYSWDMPAGGFPYALLQDELSALGVAVPTPPSPQASDMDVLAQAVGRCRPARHRHAGHHRAAHLRQLRRLLGHGARRAEHGRQAGRLVGRAHRHAEGAPAGTPGGQCGRRDHLRGPRQRHRRDGVNGLEIVAFHTGVIQRRYKVRLVPHFFRMPP